MLSQFNNIQTKVAPTSDSVPETHPFKFLIYGRTGWIGGLLGKICEKQGIPYEYGKGGEHPKQHDNIGRAPANVNRDGEEEPAGHL